MSPTTAGVSRLPSGIEGFDLIAHGGLPEGRTTLVAGTAGSGKTVVCGQFLAAGVTAGEPGVLVTFEERPEDIRRNLASFGWDIAAWEEAGSWAFVDASPRHDVDIAYLGEYDLAPLLARVRDAVVRTGAKRVAIDSIGALIAQFEVVGPARQALFKLASALTELGVTAVMTAERTDEYGPIGKLGFEEFVADSVIVLRNALDGEKRRRTIELLKLRGGSHARGEHLFTLVAGTGIVAVPASDVSLAEGTSTHRVTTGNARLDEMVGGGLFEKSLVLVAGPTGTGKSALAMHFVAGARETGQRSLLLSFEENRDQLVRNALGLGLDLGAMEREGVLRIAAEAPEAASMEDHLQRMKQMIAEFGPDRVAIDSLTALQRVATVRSFREYVLGITVQIKRAGAVGLLTSATARFLRSRSDDDLHVSTISDTIFLLNYIPVGNELRRGINVLKMRGSDHDKSVREFALTGNGMVIGEAVPEISALF